MSNSSAVWKAIYSENCFVEGSLDAMCYEERVLYRMLSGMHSSINIHIALNWYPPRAGKRTTYQPNTKRFANLFRNYPDRLKNMHFAFVVMLRALKRASVHLYSYNTSLGDSKEDLHTKQLLHRLLDSHILKSCHEVKYYYESIIHEFKVCYVGV